MASRSNLFCLVVAAAVVAIAGCRTAKQIRDPEYAQVSRAIQQAWYAPKAAVVSTAPVVAELAGPHPVEQYIQVAL